MYCSIASTKSCIVHGSGDAWSDDLLTYKEISLSIPGALLRDFVRFRGLNNMYETMTYKFKCNFQVLIRNFDQ